MEITIIIFGVLVMLMLVSILYQLGNILSTLQNIWTDMEKKDELD